MKIYIDVSCLNRPFDAQTQQRVRRESEAILKIFARVESGQWEHVTSNMTLVEIGAGADAERRARMLEMLPGASGIMYVGDAVLRRADELARFGIGPADAVHVAAAEALDADALLTCDDRLLRAARRHAGTLKVRVCNPITWMKEHEAESHG